MTYKFGWAAHKLVVVSFFTHLFVIVLFSFSSLYFIKHFVERLSKYYFENFLNPTKKRGKNEAKIYTIIFLFSIILEPTVNSNLHYDYSNRRPIEDLANPFQWRCYDCRQGHPSHPLRHQNPKPFCKYSFLKSSWINSRK